MYTPFLHLPLQFKYKTFSAKSTAYIFMHEFNPNKILKSSVIDDKKQYNQYCNQTISDNI